MWFSFNTLNLYFSNYLQKAMRFSQMNSIFIFQTAKALGIKERFPKNVFLFKIPFLYLHSDFGKRYQYSCTQL
ncbi:MAG: hypothetical protein C0433_10110 [Cyclobacterium sp.]|nr:hypothetical protein [Cyclobacterium sp.]